MVQQQTSMLLLIFHSRSVNLSKILLLFKLERKIWQEKDVTAIKIFFSVLVVAERLLTILQNTEAMSFKRDPKRFLAGVSGCIEHTFSLLTIERLCACKCLCIWKHCVHIWFNFLAMLMSIMFQNCFKSWFLKLFWENLCGCFHKKKKKKKQKW